MTHLTIRDATADDAHGLGVVMTTGFFSSFPGVTT